ncbi:MAG: N-acetyltransferase [Methanosarcina sp.]|uniref:GNAT family N-acetyltransferase n=1 Tax=Methanosarcina sp. TaxID=2213 RepID=UPI002616A35F|nr:N-acetyltransferase [Methanosarcina sp.]MDD3248146.1 N-acetyltransferase [Methanosarcina sp.]
MPETLLSFGSGENPEFSYFVLNNFGGKIVGHILFFPIRIKSEEGKEKETISLAPLAVRPEFQKPGIGGELKKEGLKVCRELGYDSVALFGHPEYYPRFGFKQASTWSIKDPFGAPDEAFMALELKKGALEGAGGVVEYPEEFNSL